MHEAFCSFQHPSHLLQTTIIAAAQSLIHITSLHNYQDLEKKTQLQSESPTDCGDSYLTCSDKDEIRCQRSRNNKATVNISFDPRSHDSKRKQSITTIEQVGMLMSDR